MTRRAKSGRDTRTLLEAAVALHRAGDLDKAAAKYRQVLAADPDQPDALSLLGQIVHQRGDSAQALQLMTRARALRPDSAAIAFNLGRVHLDLGDWEKAVEINRDAVRLAPADSATHCNLGVALTKLGQAEEGEASIRRSLALAPNNALSWSALGLALARQNRTAPARDAFEKALTLDSSLAEARFNLSELLLGEMDFARGWPLFAARSDMDRASFVTGGEMPPGIPPWRGESLTDKSILVWGEQGLGDQILFAGMIPDLQRRARHVVLACEPRLATLFARSFPNVTVIPQDENLQAVLKTESIQALVPLGTLGMYLRPDRAAFANPRPYLIADSNRVAVLKVRYRQWSGGKPVIGLSWRSHRVGIGAAKSLPVDFLAKLAHGSPATFVNLQYGDTAADSALAEASGLGLRHDPEIDPLKDPDGQAAQIAALDLVISVSNTTVHLAGGLGVPVWTLAPVGAGRMWYWFAPQPPWVNSLWYPSMRIYHQSEPGSWGPVVDRVAKNLASA